MKNKKKVKQRGNVIELWKMKQTQKRKVGKKGVIQVGIILCNTSFNGFNYSSAVLFQSHQYHPRVAFAAEAQNFQRFQRMGEPDTRADECL